MLWPGIVCLRESQVMALTTFCLIIYTHTINLLEDPILSAQLYNNNNIL